MRFNGICIITTDVLGLSSFYKKVLNVVEEEKSKDFVLLQTEGAELSFFSYEGMEKMAPDSLYGSGVGCYTIEIEVVNVDMEYERLKGLGVTFVKLPTTQPWGRRSVWLRDPDGNIVNFYSTLNKKTESQMLTHDLKRLACEYFNTLLNDKDITICDRLLSKDYSDNDAPSAAPGAEETKHYVEKLIHDYPDLRVEIYDVISEGNKVSMRNVWYGINRHSGEKMHFMGILTLEFNEQGQIKKRWSAYKPI